MKIPVAEIFGPTIQGEGPDVGSRCIFVRVMGCDFSCSFCDSKFTWRSNAKDSTECSHVDYEGIDLANKLVSMCQDTNCNQIVLTGGNPCIYDFSWVLLELKSNNIHVGVETQGSILPAWLSSADTIVFSPKPPSSNMPDVYDKLSSYLTEVFKKHNRRIHSDYAVKIPVFNDGDIEFARKYSKLVSRIDNAHLKMYLSVGNSDVDTTESIRDRVLADYESLLNKVNKNPEGFENVFILPQLHTLVWGNKQGV